MINPGFKANKRNLAFFVRPQLMENGEEVMPSYWSGNYFTLAPNESITVSASAPVAKLGKAANGFGRRMEYSKAGYHIIC